MSKTREKIDNERNRVSSLTVPLMFAAKMFAMQQITNKNTGAIEAVETLQEEKCIVWRIYGDALGMAVNIHGFVHIKGTSRLML